MESTRVARPATGAAHRSRGKDAEPIPSSSPLEAALTADREWDEEVRRQADTALATLRVGRQWTAITSGAFFAIGTGLLVYLIYYVVRNAASMGRALMGPSGASEGQGGGLQLLAERLTAVSWPILVILGLAIVCVAYALQIQRRGAEVFDWTLGTISRSRRQASLGIARSPGLKHVLEDTLQGARKAFTWSLWVSRTLFIIGLGLFMIGAADVLFGGRVNGLVVTLCASSVASMIAASLASPHRSLAAALVRVTQLQAILAGYTREASIIEEHVYQVMEHFRTIRDPAGAREAVERGVGQMASLLADTAESIRAVAEPPPGFEHGRRRVLVDLSKIPETRTREKGETGY